MAKETLMSVKKSIIETLGQKREGMNQEELFALLSAKHDSNLLSVAFWKLINKYSLHREPNGNVSLSQAEWVLHAYHVEAEALQAKLEEGVEHKKSGHRVKRFEEAGISRDQAGELPVSLGKKARQESKLRRIQAGINFLEAARRR